MFPQGRAAFKEPPLVVAFFNWGCHDLGVFDVEVSSGFPSDTATLKTPRPRGTLFVDFNKAIALWER